MDELPGLSESRPPELDRRAVSTSEFELIDRKSLSSAPQARDLECAGPAPEPPARCRVDAAKPDEATQGEVVAKRPARSATALQAGDGALASPGGRNRAEAIISPSAPFGVKSTGKTEGKGALPCLSTP
jgi:hypothetical protein